MKLIKTILIGFGNAGKGSYLKSKLGNSHFNSIRLNKNFELTAIVDPIFKANSIELHGTETFDSINCLTPTDVNLLVIASTTKSHMEVCESIVDVLKPDVVLIEKPVGLSESQCNRIENAFKLNSKVFVNYQRNYNPTIIEQLSKFKDSKNLKGTVYYSNGLLNNASHALALLIAIFGEPTNVFRIPQLSKESVSLSDVDFVVDFLGRTFTFVSIVESNYSMFRLELFSESQSWIYDAGLEKSETRYRCEDPNYVGRYSLTSKASVSRIQESESFNQVYKYIAKMFLDVSQIDETIGANLKLAASVHRSVEQILRIN